VRSGTSQLKTVLLGPFDHYYTADIYYAGERRLQNVPVTDVRLSEDGTAQIQVTGSCTIVWTDDFGVSLSPEDAQAVISPFGAEIYLYSVITAGPFIERVSLGQFRITNVPSAQDEEMFWNGQYITVGSTIQIEFMDRMQRIQGDKFDVPTVPTVLTSTWDEIARQTLLQITRNITDAPISAAVAYQEDRLQAVYDLFNVLDAVPHMTGDGTLAGRPNEWPDPVDSLLRGDGGTLVSVGKTLTTANVYNKVVVRSNTDGSQVVLASAEVSDGVLRTQNPDGSPSPWGVVTEFVDSQYVTDQTAGLDYAVKQVARDSVLPQRVVPVVEVFNPLRERGDVITLQRAKTTLTGRVQSIDRDNGATQSLQVAISG
jgi:hypothetical protein